MCTDMCTNLTNETRHINQQAQIKNAEVPWAQSLGAAPHVQPRFHSQVFSVATVLSVETPAAYTQPEGQC